jgi:hypothetical protein
LSVLAAVTELATETPIAFVRQVMIKATMALMAAIAATRLSDGVVCESK